MFHLSRARYVISRDQATTKEARPICRWRVDLRWDHRRSETGLVGHVKACLVFILLVLVKGSISVKASNHGLFKFVDGTVHSAAIDQSNR